MFSKVLKRNTICCFFCVVAREIRVKLCTCYVHLNTQWARGGVWPCIGHGKLPDVVHVAGLIKFDICIDFLQFSKYKQKFARGLGLNTTCPPAAVTEWLRCLTRNQVWSHAWVRIPSAAILFCQINAQHPPTGSCFFFFDLPMLQVAVVTWLGLELRKFCLRCNGSF